MKKNAEVDTEIMNCIVHSVMIIVRSYSSCVYGFESLMYDKVYESGC